jgi:NAD/NADP transhydrogenase beta subunit
MNRSLLNVIIGVFGGGGAAAAGEAGNIKEVTVADAAVLLSYSKEGCDCSRLWAGCGTGAAYMP